MNCNTLKQAFASFAIKYSYISAVIDKQSNICHVKSQHSELQKLQPQAVTLQVKIHQGL